MSESLRLKLTLLYDRIEKRDESRIKPKNDCYISIEHYLEKTNLVTIEIVFDLV